MQQTKVLPIVGNQNPSLLCRNEQVLIIACGLEPPITRGACVMPQGSKLGGDTNSYMVFV